MSNMSEERIITVDEVQAAIDLEVSVLKKGIELIAEQVGAMAAHMNENFNRQADAIMETQTKHNKLALMFTSFVETMEQLDCIKGD